MRHLQHWSLQKWSHHTLPYMALGPFNITEPIFVPKLRIYFADFPCYYSSRPRGCSPWRPNTDVSAVHHWCFMPQDFKVRLQSGSAIFSMGPRACLPTEQFQGTVGCQPEPQSKQRGHLGRNFGYAILGLIVVSGLSSRWQNGNSLHAI